uniref:Uncharacterized protein n=1 Tax=Anguilla anguilla TaxID=7936 RepID=A0A0E9RL72_ANGAN
MYTKMLFITFECVCENRKEIIIIYCCHDFNIKLLQKSNFFQFDFSALGFNE